MDSATRAVLASFAKDGVGVDGPVVESDLAFYKRFRKSLPGVEDRRAVEVVRGYVSKSTSELGLRDWRRKLRRVGYRAVWGDRVVSRECPEFVLVYRLAVDWRVGLSWAMDPRRCESMLPVTTGEPLPMTLWAAVVPADAVFAHYWSLQFASETACPLWKTLETEFGRVAVAVDDFSEVLVDPARLVDGDVLSPGVVVAVHEFDQVDVDVDHEQFAMLLNAAWNWRSASPRG
ncbi:hypothetical protein [Gordonia amicalis]|uniref:hypothetical protein n=1 Tax=Gordonia amicalis TaxID=89053 RepID=UPI0005558A2E|nr:hypothetical protein [Gordonia amicalis]